MTTIGIRLPKAEKAILAKAAQRTDTTISQILRRLIRDYVGSIVEASPASKEEMKKENVYE